MIEHIKWLGHGSFLIQEPLIIYINPWRIVRSAFLADIILVSHDHYEHCSVADIQKVMGEETKIIGNDNVKAQLPSTFTLRYWQSMTIEPVNILAVPAYSPNDYRHPLEDKGLGFVISANYYDIYYAGDTQIIPEMQHIHPDIAILPIDSNGTLGIDEAVEVVKIMQPKWVIPSNWGNRNEGATHFDVQEFTTKIGARTKVIIPK